MATYDEVTEVRELIGESIPDGGSATDTMFSDVQVSNWITLSSSPEGAALRGWRAKMANYSSLVTVTDGAALRQLSDLMTHAEYMVKYYTGLTSSPPAAAGRTRIGKIVRTPWL